MEDITCNEEFDPYEYFDIVPIYFIDYCLDGEYDWLIETPNFKVIRFGKSGTPNYLNTQDTKVRDQYLNNLKHPLTVEDIYTSEFWERYLLFNRSSLYLSIRDVELTFTVEIRPMHDNWTSCE